MPKEEKKGHKGEKHHGGKERTIKSMKSDQQVDLTFENYSNEPVTVWWHNYEGVKEDAVGVLDPEVNANHICGVNSAFTVTGSGDSKTIFTLKGRNVMIVKESDHEKNIRIEVKKDIKKCWEVKKNEKGMYKVDKTYMVNIENIPLDGVNGQYRMAKDLVINHHMVWFNKDQSQYAYYMGKDVGTWAIGSAEMLEAMIQDFKADPKFQVDTGHCPSENKTTQFPKTEWYTDSGVVAPTIKQADPEKIAAKKKYKEDHPEEFPPKEKKEKKSKKDKGGHYDEDDDYSYEKEGKSKKDKKDKKKKKDKGGGFDVSISFDMWGSSSSSSYGSDFYSAISDMASDMGSWFGGSSDSDSGGGWFGSDGSGSHHSESGGGWFGSNASESHHSESHHSESQSHHQSSYQQSESHHPTESHRSETESEEEESEHESEEKSEYDSPPPESEEESEKSESEEEEEESVESASME